MRTGERGTLLLAMIELSDVHLTLPSAAGPVTILRGIDLTVEVGGSVSVVGPSGSGKSSLMSIIGGIERPTAGRVVVDGVDLATLDEDGLALFRRDRVGILFQSFHLIPTMTAIENVALPLELAGDRDAFAAAEALLGEVGLADRARPLSGPALGRRAAARGAGAGAGQSAAPAAGRRADRQSRRRHRQGRGRPDLRRLLGARR